MLADILIIVITLSCLQAKCEYYVEKTHTFRCMKKKMADVSPPESVNVDVSCFMSNTVLSFFIPWSNSAKTFYTVIASFPNLHVKDCANFWREKNEE